MSSPPKTREGAAGRIHRRCDEGGQDDHPRGLKEGDFRVMMADQSGGDQGDQVDRRRAAGRSG